MTNETYVEINGREITGVRKWLIIAAACVGVTLALFALYAVLTSPVWITALLLT